MTDPYAELRAHGAWTLCFADLPGDERGRWYNRLQTIVLATGLTQVERRCTVAHEVEHALAGDEPLDDAALNARREQARHRDAARKLLPYAALEAAMLAHPDDSAAVAEELHVDVETLKTRLDTLHPSERHALRRALEARGAIA